MTIPDTATNNNSWQFWIAFYVADALLNVLTIFSYRFDWNLMI